MENISRQADVAVLPRQRQPVGFQNQTNIQVNRREIIPDAKYTRILSEGKAILNFIKTE